MPVGNGEPVMIVSRGAFTVSVRSLEAVVPELSATCTVRLKDPAACGVPERVPALASKVIPAGN